MSGIPQLLDDLGLPAAAARSSPRLQPPDRRAAPRAASGPAAIATLRPEDQPLAQLVADGSATVDELVAYSGATIGAVLAGLTRLEAAGLVRDRHGRYEPAGPLLASGPKRGRQSAASAATIPPPA